MRFFNWMFSSGFNGLLVGFAGLLLLIGVYNETLPPIQDYDRPPVLSRVYAGDGALIGQYAKERRLYTPYELLPKHLVSAFVAAEDQNFFRHPGIDGQGIARAFLNNIEAMFFGSGGGLEGASTITQQLVKNLYFDTTRSVDRKLKEILVSLKVERAYSKEKIIELYLNWIFLGAGSYGVGEASLRYFDKPVYELNVSEGAFLAALPKSPARYHPKRHPERARDRRNWVLGRMVIDGYITEEEADAARAEPLPEMNRRGQRIEERTYFSEEVRRNLIDQFSNDGLYANGLSVQTSMNRELQFKAQKSLLKGTFNFSKSLGWNGPIAQIDPVGDWGVSLLEVKAVLNDLAGWTSAVVLEVNGDSATIGLRPESGSSSKRSKGKINFSGLKWASNALNGQKPRRVADVLGVGDVIYVELVDKAKKLYGLRKLPEIQGAAVVMDPKSGRVYAVVGGNSFAFSEFNRATQAKRQPGSSFKPIVYASAIEQGYTPATVVLDAPIAVDQKNKDGIWRPSNYAKGFLGPTTLRQCLEKSCNLLTVRLARDLGIPTIVAYAEALGAYENLKPFLSVALGSDETTPLRMATAFSAFANGGYSVEPSLVDRIQDREGRVVYRHAPQACPGCEISTSLTAPPRLVDKRKRVFSALTAYQINEMLQGVVQSGTGTRAKIKGEVIGGKTGTSNDEKDAWFVGFSSDIVIAVWVGHDTPTPMGRGGTGGGVAAPIFKEIMTEALKSYPSRPFSLPGSGEFYRFDKVSGNRLLANASGTTQTFRTFTGPGENLWIYGNGKSNLSNPIDTDIGGGTGGLY